MPPWGCLANDKLVKRDEHGQQVLSCPNCRHPTPIPANGVAGLQPAFQANNLLEIHGDLKEEAQSQVGASGATIDGASGVTAPTKVISYCSEQEHANEEIKVYCEDCKLFVCNKCVMSGAEHHSHSYKTLESYRQDLLSCADKLSTARDEAKRKIDTQCAEIRDQQAGIEDRLDKTVNQLHETLKACNTELKLQLHNLVTNKRDILEAQKAEIDMQLQQYSTDDIHKKLQLLNDDRDIVAMHGNKTTQINELISKIQAMKPATVADMDLSVQDNLRARCDDYGKITSDDLLPDPSKCSVQDTACLKSATVGTPLGINVKAYGNPCLHGRLPQLHFELVSEFNDEGTHGQCEGSNSFYRVMFTSTVKGQNKLHITINDQPISGSPFAVHVNSSVENLGDQISRIDGLTRPWGIVVNEKREIFVSEST